MNLLTLAGWSVRISGLIVLALGLALWTGSFPDLRGIHMLAGLVLVISLWVVAVLAARAGAPVPLIVVALLWGVLTIGLGLYQAQILPGDLHWLVQVGHLVVGLVAIGLGEALTARARSSSARA
jgi:energy-coupling factor transporter transmembrane protein EcfT